MVADIFIGLNFYTILEQEGRKAGTKGHADISRARKNDLEYSLGHARVGKLTDKI